MHSSLLMVVVVVIFNLGWLHREVVDCWCLRCVVLLLCGLSNILYEKERIEIGRRKAFSEEQSTLPFVQGND